MKLHIKNEYEKWLKSTTVSLEDKKVLRNLKPEEIEYNFSQNLKFGTGGLRGVMGVGNNCMNIYTVRKASQGLANYMKAQKIPLHVVICYDSRINSKLFAQETASVFAANGIAVDLFSKLEPTPVLSFATRYLKCGIGICLTASHNPFNYNGYKVYNSDGSQITLNTANSILDEINKVDIFNDIKVINFSQGVKEKLILYAPEEVLNCYIDSLKKTLFYDQSDLWIPLKIVYTPLNGTGLECIKRIFNAIHIYDITVVPEQELPDGSFKTCPTPNPELLEAMQMGIELSKQEHSDLLLGTDPDCDRVSVAVPFLNDYILLSGNELGVLLFDFICKMRIKKNIMPNKPMVFSTIVSTDMAIPIAEKYGVELIRTLTGFKFIGEQISILDQNGQADRFIFAFEESCGYLSNTNVRDKDGVNASALICEMARYYKKRNKTLYDALVDLYTEFGYYQNKLITKNLAQPNGVEKISLLMDTLRSTPPVYLAGQTIVTITDYLCESLTGLPKSNVLEYQLSNKAKLIIRPSGTEPKIKVYISAVENSMEKSQNMIQCLENDILKTLEDIIL